MLFVLVRVLRPSVYGLMMLTLTTLMSTALPLRCWADGPSGAATKSMPPLQVVVPQRDGECLQTRLYGRGLSATQLSGKSSSFTGYYDGRVITGPV